MAYRQYISGLKSRPEQSKEARIHYIDYGTLERACRRPKQALIGPAGLVCWEGEAGWTCNEYTIMVRICGAGGGLGSEFRGTGFLYLFMTD